MSETDSSIYHEIANAVRQLSMDAVEKANSGHPGLPMGCAEIGAYLWANFMRYNPKNPDWFNRDRFVLSAGHGSAFLYSLLYLSGYNVTLDDLKQFRQLGSKTPGHPEKLDTEGVEVTTGPLGQGVANAVGMALSMKILENRYNRDDFPVVDNKVICLAGDGCLMEGISTEASSFAGHLCLNNLILIYDMNYITLDGLWKESCTDDQAMRYKAMGWNVVHLEDGNDIYQVEKALKPLRGQLDKPTIVIAHTVIGKGAPHKEGSHKAHGSPLGKEELAAAKKNLGLSEEPFLVEQSVYDFFAKRQKECAEYENTWNALFNSWKQKHPDLSKLFDQMQTFKIPQELKKEIEDIKLDAEIAGRKASQAVLQVLGKHLPNLIGGSADLSGSDATMMKEYPIITPDDFSGRNVKYGIREFAMTAMANGMSTTHLRPYVGTFFCFSDYAKNALRLAALSEHPIVCVYTHDSIGLGEDGPTHQPVEHLAGLRAMPGLHLFRPGDAWEVKAAWWWIANQTKGPCALVLTRQELPTLEETQKISFEEGVGRGGYILSPEDTQKSVDYTLIATGSELHLAMLVAKKLRENNKNVRVVSLPSFHLFEEQDQAYKNQVLGKNLGQRVSIEAGSSFGWDRYIGDSGIAISIDSFGASAPIKDVMKKFGFTVEQILEKIQNKCHA